MSTFKGGTYGELLKWEKEQAEEKAKAKAITAKPYVSHCDRVINILLENGKELSDALKDDESANDTLIKKTAVREILVTIAKKIVQASIEDLHPNRELGWDPYNPPFPGTEFDRETGEYYYPGQ